MLLKSYDQNTKKKPRNFRIFIISYYFIINKEFYRFSIYKKSLIIYLEEFATFVTLIIFFSNLNPVLYLNTCI